MTRRRGANTTEHWWSFVTTGYGFIGAVLGFIFAAATFYVSTTNGLQSHDKAIKELTETLKTESSVRIKSLDEEAKKRDQLRVEYLTAIKEQTQQFGTIGERVNTLAADMKANTAVLNMIKQQADSLMSGPPQSPAYRRR